MGIRGENSVVIVKLGVMLDGQVPVFWVSAGSKLVG